MSAGWTYDVCLTPCWPNAWYGGPFWHGRKMSNAACYYHRTEEDAIAFCLKMLDAQQKDQTCQASA